MPVHHHTRRVVRRAATPAAAAKPTVDAIGADTITPPATPYVPETPSPALAQARAPAKSAKASRKTQQQPAAATIPFSFGDDTESAAPSAAPTAQPPTAPQTPSSPETKTALLPPRPATPKPSALRARPAAPSARNDEHAGLAKRGAVLFQKGVSNPSPAQFQGVRVLASALSTALESGASRIQLEAYSGPPGDKSSDAHRLSLERALAVRQLLIDDGVPSNRIDVRAMGGAADNGPNDRVDVFVRSS